MMPCFEEQLAVISESFNALSEEQFRSLAGRCTEVLKSGGKIIASGLGKNVPICEKFVGTMNSLGMDARFLHTNSAIHGDLGMVFPGDFVLMLSKSGNTAESVTLVNHLLERRTEVWLLSFNEESKLASMLKNRIILHLKDEGDPWNIVPNNSTIIYLIFLQGLVMRIAENMNVQLRDFAINHPGGGIGEKLRNIHHA
ncbi:MAG: SIS domain-containing protein [Treponema sp.]|jgi:arabinose-5-phosphate isomerase|nr:SIS domain-containing protein [Treponema sp.]